MSDANVAEFELFFREHYQDLCGYAYKIIGDSGEAEDVVQLFFIKLWEDRERLNILSFKSYAYKSVRNRCLNALVKDSKLQRESVSSLVETMFDSVYDADDNIYAYRGKAREAINKIPKKSRRILLMHCVLGLKYQDISDVLGISRNTVKSQIMVAYKIIRADLGDIFSVLLFLWLYK